MMPLLLSAYVLVPVALREVHACQTIAATGADRTLTLHTIGRRISDPIIVAAGNAEWLELVATAANPSDLVPPDAVLQLQSFALYALSRGAGLTDVGRRALDTFRELLRDMEAQGQVERISDTRIGIEGETRICAKFATSDLAGKAWTQMRRLSVEADLVQLKAEKC